MENKILPSRKSNRLADYDYSQNGVYFITICSKDKQHLFGKVVSGSVWEAVSGCSGSAEAVSGCPHGGAEPVGAVALDRPNNITSRQLKAPVGTVAFERSHGSIEPVSDCPHGGAEPVGAVALDRPNNLTNRPFMVLNALGKCAEETIMIQNKNDVKITKHIVMPNHIHLLILIDKCGRSGATAPTSSVQQVVRNIKSFVAKTAKFDVWQKGFHDHIVRDDGDYEKIYEYIDTNPDRWGEDEYYR